MRRLLPLVCLLLAACAATPRLEAPTVGVSRVRVDRLTAADARFTIVVTIANPNDRNIAVDAIDARLTIENVDVGIAHLSAPVILPARGETTAAIAAHADLASSLRATAEVAQRLADSGGTPPGVRYVVSGQATINGGTVVPFSRKGEFKLTLGGDAP